MTRVLIVGFDGADWELIFNWANKEKLPNFKRLIQQGVFGPLESTIPPITPPAWTSMTTGKNPEKHGILGFIKMTYTPNKWCKSIYTSLDKKSKELWDYVDKSIVVNVPITYPPRKIDGIMVTGMLTPSLDSEFTYPPEFKNELLKKIPEYIIELDWAKYRSKKKKFITRLYDMTKKRIDLFWYLFNNKPWKLMFFVFIGPDRIQHIFWEARELEKYWKYLDNFLGEIITKAEEENIHLFVVSDHGFCGVERSIYINNILLDLGFLKLKLHDNSNVIFGHSLLYKIIKGAARAYLKLPYKIRELLRPIISKVYTSPKFDLENSVAFCISEGSFGSIYINPKFSREEVILKIKRVLESIIDKKTKRRPIYKVFRREELYGRASEDIYCPDLIVIPSEGYEIGEYNPLGLLADTLFKNGDHRLYGIFFAYGYGIKKGYKIENAKIYDIVPTILHIFGLPIPNDMDGRVLTEIFEPDSEFARRKPKYVDPSYYEKKQEIKENIKRKEDKKEKEYSKKDEEIIKERLRALGYLK